jgi:hypothetical protein
MVKIKIYPPIYASAAFQDFAVDADNSKAHDPDVKS